MTTRWWLSTGNTRAIRLIVKLAHPAAINANSSVPLNGVRSVPFAASTLNSVVNSTLTLRKIFNRKRVTLIIRMRTTFWQSGFLSTTATQP